MDEELIKKLNYIRFPGLLENWDRYLKLSQKKNLSSVALLKQVVEDGYNTKKENSKKFRFCRAKIPEPYRIETFPFESQPHLNKKKVLSVYDSGDYLTKQQNIIWIGPTGTGKTGLATAFLSQAIELGYKGRFIVFPELIELLYNSVADHSEAKTIKQFASYDTLLIDELGYVEVEPVQVGLFFSLMQKRHKKKTTMITSNLGFQQWNSFLKNDHLTAALIDRLTENAHVINMKKCTSLRPKLKLD